MKINPPSDAFCLVELFCFLLVISSPISIIRKLLILFLFLISLSITNRYYTYSSQLSLEGYTYISRNVVEISERTIMMNTKKPIVVHSFRLRQFQFKYFSFHEFYFPQQNQNGFVNLYRSGSVYDGFYYAIIKISTHV